MTTCPVVCVASVDDCPTTCTGNTTLCGSGSCEEDCSGYEATPCGCPSLPVACPKVIDYYDDCINSFQSFYDNNTACLGEQEYSTPPMSYTEPIFVFGYSWICTVTVLVIGWCFYNEKLYPRREVTSVCIQVKHTSKANAEQPEFSMQTGYKRTIVGSLIYIMVVMTLIGIQLVLFSLVILYYVQVGAVTRWPQVFNVFNSVDQVNKTFISVWMIGFPWTMAFCFIPTGIHTLFLRRCPIATASFVAIVSPEMHEQGSSRSGGSAKLIKMARWLTYPLSSLLLAVFSYPYGLSGHDVTFSAVKIGNTPGERGIFYRLRKYVWSESAGGFIAGKIRVGKTFSDFLSQAHGLRSDQVFHRIGIVGSNKAPVAKPTMFSSLRKEFSKGFYVYQVGIHVVGLLLTPAIILPDFTDVHLVDVVSRVLFSFSSTSHDRSCCRGLYVRLL
jgi:hypothetical protein